MVNKRGFMRQWLGLESFHVGIVWKVEKVPMREWL